MARPAWGLRPRTERGQMTGSEGVDVAEPKPSPDPRLCPWPGEAATRRGRGDRLTRAGGGVSPASRVSSSGPSKTGRKQSDMIRILATDPVRAWLRVERCGDSWPSALHAQTPPDPARWGRGEGRAALTPGCASLRGAGAGGRQARAQLPAGRRVRARPPAPQSRPRPRAPP